MIEISKARYRISLDHEIAFVLYRGDLRIFGIREGEELDEADYYKIVSEVLPKRAKLRLMNLLQTKDYTEYQMIEKLKQGFYPEPVIKEALEYVKSYGYVDDERYCKQYIESMITVKSRRKLQQDLQTKGIGKELFTQIYEEVLSEGRVMDQMTCDEVEQIQIRKFLEKKRFNPEETDFKEKQKLIQSLFRKGYHLSNITTIVGSYDEI